jgi:hypothetical protein
MRTTKKLSLLILLCFVLVNMASSATNFSGGKKKSQEKGGVKMTLGKKALTLNNGFHFRGGFSFNSSNSNSGIRLNNNPSIRFQRGNNLYVLPYKSKPFYSKFKTPEKQLK